MTRTVPAHEELRFAYDYNQLYIYDAAHKFDAAASDFLDALDAATQSGLTLGVACGVVDLLMPRQDNFSASLRVDITDSRPPIIEEADHIEIPAGRHRARFSGFGFDAATAWSYDDPGDPPDHYHLELWPAAHAEAPAELRRWAGYTDRL